MKISEFRRWLESRGARVGYGRKHWKIYMNGRQTTLPRHPAQELSEGLRKAILKQLGIMDRIDDGK